MDYGPFVPIVQIMHPGGTGTTPAVLLQEDGSGFACYPSGNKAVCCNCHNRNRRVSIFLYSDGEFNVQLPTPNAPAAPPGVRDITKGVVRKKLRNRSRHLGALDDLGVGRLEAVPDQTGARGSYEVSATHVTVTAADGKKRSLMRSEPTASEQKLRLSKDLVVSFDGQLTVIEFSCEGVQHTFYAGEVWKAPAGSPAALSLTQTTPEEVLGTVPAKWQPGMDVSVQHMVETTLLAKRTLRNSSSLPSLKSSSAPLLCATAKLAESAKSLCENRLDFVFEHRLKKSLSDKHPALDRTKVPLRRENVDDPDGPPLGHRNPVDNAIFGGPPPEVAIPMKSRVVSAGQVADLVRQLEAKPVLIVCLVVANWARSSIHNSSTHARAHCEAALGEITTRGDGGRIQLVEAELTEAGAIFSETKFTNPLVKQFRVKSAPWLLMFRSGEIVYSDRPTADIPDRGGLGFCARLRYPTLSKPRALIIEPQFRLQLETQEVMKHSGFSYDLALNATEGRRMAAMMEPPYGILVASTEIGAGELGVIVNQIARRCQRPVSFMIHDGKAHGPLTTELRQLSEQKELWEAVIHRPLTKSYFQKVTATKEDLKMNYPEAGVTKEVLVRLFDRWLPSG